MPWWSKSKKDDEVVHSLRPKKLVLSTKERGGEPARRAPLATSSKEPKRKYHSSALRDTYETDDGPNGSVPALTFLKTSVERTQRVKDSYEPVAKSATPQPYSLTHTLKPSIPRQSQKTRIVVGIDFGTTSVAWCARLYGRFTDAPAGILVQHSQYCILGMRRKTLKFHSLAIGKGSSRAIQHRTKFLP